MDTKETAVPEDNLLSNNTAQKTLETTTISRPLLLFEHVTTLVSGLIAVGLLSLAGYTLLDYWLGENNTMNYLNSYLYGFYLYLLCGLLFFTALHFWAHWRSERKLGVADEAQPINRTTHAFLVIFLVILTVAVVSNIVAVAYIALNAALGTADYSTKGLWNALLGPLQAGLWAGLLCWYFKGTGKGRSTMVYLAVNGVISLLAAGLLFAFPIMAKRDTVIDSRTSDDLSSISFAINEFVNDNIKLPDTLSELKLDDKIKARFGVYEYEKTNTSTKIGDVEPVTSEDANDTISDLLRAPSQQFSYKLCANFKTDTSKDNDRSPIPFLATSSDFGTHPAGKHCFDKIAYGKNLIDDQPASSDSSGSSLERY